MRAEKPEKKKRKARKIPTNHFMEGTLNRTFKEVYKKDVIARNGRRICGH
jgi:hypothetical protein